MLLAQDGKNIIGVMSLHVLELFHQPGRLGRITSLVIDDDFRGQGVGKALIQAAIEKSHDLGAKTLDLTSNPDRESAHRLYEGAGFSVRTTKVYRHIK